MKKALSGSYLVELASTFLVTVFTFPELDYQTHSGYDAAYFFALNYFFREGLEAGKDFIFTYGPLGFLKDPQAIAGLSGLGIALILSVRLWTAWLLLRLGKTFGTPWWITLPVVAFTLASLQSLDYVVWLSGMAGALLHVRTRKFSFFLHSSAAPVLGMLIKNNIGFTTAVAVGCYYLFHNSFQRWGRIFFFLGGCFFFYLGAWLILHGGIKGSFYYLLQSFIIAYDSVGTMVLPTDFDLFPLGISLSLFFLWSLWRWFSGPCVWSWSMWPVLFLVYRYSVARSDYFHLAHGYFFLLAVLALDLLQNPTHPGALAILALSLLFWKEAVHSLPWIPRPIPFPELHIQGFNKSLIQFEKTNDAALTVLPKNLQKDSLPDHWIRRIGNESVDFFPWPTSSIARYGLNYRPRPLIQHGLVASAFLDKWNCQRLIKNDQRARYLIWHGGWDSSGVTCMDGRYVWAEQVRTLWFLWHYYEVKDYVPGRGWLMESRSRTAWYRHPDSVSMAQRYEICWNQWVTLPPVSSSSVLLARLEAPPYLPGFIRSTFFKEALYEMDFWLASGEIKTHRLALPGAKDMMVLNPYWEKIGPQPIMEKVVKVRLRCLEGVPSVGPKLILRMGEAEHFFVSGH
ncbi:MAG: hypothetical protein N2110_04590 [Flavobacteriales bacterium]|nr:hypothetical protein [Flavobacteriales bacterium]MCX7768287.1 hypothetical protein [Flavobacteriales bacterium]MDW8410528.1 hypothetical protein [Flavobacteriales bacterium]